MFPPTSPKRDPGLPPEAGGCQPFWLSTIVELMVLVDSATTEETIELFLAVMSRMHQHVVERSAEFDLSAPQARALHYLGEPRTMGELADMLCCDASNVTGIVDRLEARGVVERQTVPGDRRVQRVVLTDDGPRLWAEP